MLKIAGGILLAMAILFVISLLVNIAMRK